MIEKTLKTTEGKLRIKVPDRLNEVTLGQMMELQERQNINDLEAISILSDVPLKDLQNVIDINELGAFAEPILSLSYQIKYLYNSDDIPKNITFSLQGKKVTIPVINNLSVEPAGAFMAAREIIADEIGEHINKHGEENLQEHFSPSLKACCHVLAHYFFCRVTGKRYNEYEAEEFCVEIKKLGVTEALPVAKHFFTCYPSLSKQSISFWHQLQLLWKRRQAYKLLSDLNISTL
jgi:hypothetical protein